MTTEERIAAYFRGLAALTEQYQLSLNACNCCNAINLGDLTGSQGDGLDAAWEIDFIDIAPAAVTFAVKGIEVGERSPSGAKNRRIVRR